MLGVKEKKQQIPRTASRAPKNQGQGKSARDFARDDRLLLLRRVWCPWIASIESAACVPSVSLGQFKAEAYASEGNCRSLSTRRVLRFAEEKAKARDAALGMTRCCFCAEFGGY